MCSHQIHHSPFYQTDFSPSCYVRIDLLRSKSSLYTNDTQHLYALCQEFMTLLLHNGLMARCAPILANSMTIMNLSFLMLRNLKKPRRNLKTTVPSSQHLPRREMVCCDKKQYLGGFSSLLLNDNGASLGHLVRKAREFDSSSRQREDLR